MKNKNWLKLGLVSGLFGIVSPIVGFTVIRAQITKYVSALESGESLEAAHQFLDVGQIALTLSVCISTLALLLLILSTVGYIKSKRD